MNRAIEAKAIEYLDAFRQRKGMYVQPLDASNVQGYLHGFHIGYVLGRNLVDDYTWHRATEQRGWACGAMSPADVMRGLDDEAIMDELIEIEILALRLLAGDESRGDGLIHRPDPAVRVADDGSGRGAALSSTPGDRDDRMNRRPRNTGPSAPARRRPPGEVRR